MTKKDYTLCMPGQSILRKLNIANLKRSLSSGLVKVVLWCNNVNYLLRMKLQINYWQTQIFYKLAKNRTNDAESTCGSTVLPKPPMHIYVCISHHWRLIKRFKPEGIGPWEYLRCSGNWHNYYFKTNLKYPRNYELKNITNHTESDDLVVDPKIKSSA